ncbi:MAG: NADH:ubiquinone reductase (Na(+)-transporting) subunit C [Candidatus Cryptobacteroides sp.]
MNTNSNTYTVIYSIVLVVVVAAILAFTSQALKDKQNENVKLETITKVISAAVQADPDYVIAEDADILDEYQKLVVDACFVDAEGNCTGQMNIGKEDKKAIEVASTSDLKKQNDIIKKIEAGDAAAAANLRLPVYIFDINGQKVTVIPCYGAGLWGPVWGYLSFTEDGRTFGGAIFDHKSETPGLGAKITEEPFYSQFHGRSITDEGYFGVIKGGARDKNHEVDAISGASITSGAVGTTVRTWVKYYLPYLNRLAAESAAAQEPVAEENVEPTTEEE